MDQDLFTSSWKMLVIRGAVGIVFGILAIAWPIETGLALMLLWGFWVLVEGISLLVQAFRSKTEGSRLGRAVVGVVAIIVAFFAIFSPAVTAQTLTWFVGIWLILRGVFEVFTAFSSYRLTPRWLLLVGAALSILLGVFFVANPGRGAVGIAVWLGLIALAWGVVLVVMGWMLRREQASPAPAGQAAA
jgi:uncharacterized membrane protein HdeD (DUF308 family)